MEERERANGPRAERPVRRGTWCRTDLMTQTRNRRKKIVILKEMQARIIARTTAFPLAGLTFLATLTVYFCLKLMDDAAAAEATLPHLEPLLATVICLTAGIAAVILYVALRFSHTVAGPTYRIVESLKRMQRGDLDFRVQLRRKDFLTEIAEEMNRTLPALRDQVQGHSDETAEADADQGGEPVAAGHASETEASVK